MERPALDDFDGSLPPSAPKPPEEKLEGRINSAAAELTALLGQLSSGFNLTPDTRDALGRLSSAIAERTMPAKGSAIFPPQPASVDLRVGIGVAEQPEIKAAIQRFPKVGEEIIELARLYCDPRLYNCEVIGRRVYYTDPKTGEKRELAHLGGGSQRHVFEGPTSDTVIKLVPTGYSSQSSEELAIYVQADKDARRKFVRILGYRLMPIDTNKRSIVILEERIEPLKTDPWRDMTDLTNDIIFIEKYPNSTDNERRFRLYGLTDLDQLRRLKETVEWGRGSSLVDANFSNIGLARDGRFVYHDIGSRRSSSDIVWLLDPKDTGIDFESVRKRIAA